MSFGQQLRKRREELKISRSQLADMLGVTKSAIGNYETGVSTPKEEVLLKIFDALQVEPNYLYRDSFRFREEEGLTLHEQWLLQQFRALPAAGQQAVTHLLEDLGRWNGHRSSSERERRRIPLYFSPAAAGYAAPILGDDFEYLAEERAVPQGTEFAVRIQGDSMQPYIQDHSVVYVSRETMKNGDVGIFCVDGEMLCKQYILRQDGSVSLLSLNRARADADVHLTAGSERTLVCFGKVIMGHVPNAEELA